MWLSICFWLAHLFPQKQPANKRWRQVCLHFYQLQFTSVPSSDQLFVAWSLLWYLLPTSQSWFVEVQACSSQGMKTYNFRREISTWFVLWFADEHLEKVPPCCLSVACLIPQHTLLFSQGGFGALIARIMLGLKTVWYQSHCGLQ